jgi:hypothetical protein
MIKEMLGLAFFSFSSDSSGGQFGSLIDSLNQMGFFRYILPCLLIFALVYGILLKMKMFEKNSINVIISLIVGLLAVVTNDTVPAFFAQIFPRLGIGLAVLLVALIILGLFLPNQAWMGYVLFGVAAVTFLTILVQSSADFSSSIVFSWISDNWTWIFAIVFAIIVFALTVKDKTTDKGPKTLGDIIPHLKYEK